MIPDTFTSQSPALPQTKDSLRNAAVELEANFLAEMLRAAGLSRTSGSSAGGVGEDQFSSFLVIEQARLMAQAGGIGLAEVLFDALVERAHDK
ncbi:rod-binding protein [Albibacillus kandeliae]|uniref:rod-binding protein n=1 Tax=Albibacillus kandeliae TaxID=2174228 RepID=UPI000D69E1CF|nr:rod-binding protein [Albibacillus kandeliae]